MDGVARLLDWFDRGLLVRPDPGRPGFVDLVAAAAARAGVRGAPIAPAAADLAAEIGDADPLVLVLVDGMGARALERLPAGAFLRRRLARELRSVFPSTTAAALTTLATGQWPSRHAVIGWWTYLADRALSAVTIPFAERFAGTPLGELGVAPGELFPVEALWARAARATLTVVPADYLGSVFTTYTSGGTSCAGYRDLDQALALVEEAARAPAPPGFLYLYLPHLDELGHRVGSADPRFVDLLADLDRRLERLAIGLGGRARLAITADHGMVDPGPDGDRFLDPDDPLLALLEAPPSVEATAPAFHVRPGREAAFAAAFADRFGDRFALVPADQVERLGLLGPGPLHPAARSRLGSFLAVAGRPSALYFRPPGGRFHVHVGVHAGLTDAETAIPLALA